MEAVDGDQFLINYLLWAVRNTVATLKKFPMDIRYWRTVEAGKELLWEIGIRKEIIDNHLTETGR